MSGEAKAVADPSHGSLSAFATASSTFLTVAPTALSHASSRDLYTLAAIAAMPEPVTLTITARVKGSISGNGFKSALYQLDVSTFVPPGGPTSECTAVLPTPGNLQAICKTKNVLVANASNSFFLRQFLGVSITPLPGESMTADYGDTAEIISVQVLDSNGQPIPFSLTTESGFTFPSETLSETPEPATLVLLASTMAGLGLTARWKQGRKR